MRLAIPEPACMPMVIGEVSAGIHEPIAAPEQPIVARLFALLCRLARKGHLPGSQHRFSGGSGQQTRSRAPRFETIHPRLVIELPIAMVTPLEQIGVDASR